MTSKRGRFETDLHRADHSGKPCAWDMIISKLACFWLATDDGRQAEESVSIDLPCERVILHGVGLGCKAQGDSGILTGG